MRSTLAISAVLFALVGCAASAGLSPQSPAPLRFGEVLAQQAAAPTDATKKLTPPRGECARAVGERLRGAKLLSDPLPPLVDDSLRAVLESLHPIARQVLARTHGLWIADDIPGAAGVFFPCDVDTKRARGGFVVVDLAEFGVVTSLRDADVPWLYWQTLAPAHIASRALPLEEPRSVAPEDHPLRYLLHHELGHALGVLAEQFPLDDEGRMSIERDDGFVGYSWRLVTAERGWLPADRGAGSLVQVVVPRGELNFFEWGSVLAVLDADPTLLAPGYALAPPRSSTDLARRVCGAVDKLPAAGFVTPTAARYPTEDFAEMFAHALLADEGKIQPTDRVRLELPHCDAKHIPSPYFAAGVAPKRHFLEAVLGLAD